MNNQLRELYTERDAVNRMTETQAISQYNCDYKQEVLNLIQEEIESIESELNNSQCYYEDEELESERSNLCLSLGISRYC